MMKCAGMLCAAALFVSAASAEEFAQAAFPLHVAAGGRHLEDAQDRPFIIHADTAWSLIAELTREETLVYLSDRKQRGFNAIVTSLIERQFASNAPANAYGERPFLRAGGFSQPNDRYLDHAEWVLRTAGEMGFLVLLAPAYLGIGGGDQGWYREMEAAGPKELSAYGRYLGERFGDLPNILWLHGGDYDPPDKDLIRAIAEGLSSTGAVGLSAFHPAPESITLDQWRGEPWLDLDTVYTYQDVHARVLERYLHGDGKPVLMLESGYEGERGTDAGDVRETAYGAMLAGAAGHVFGNNPIWHFSGPGIHSSEGAWQDALASPGGQSMTHLRRLFEALPWWTLEPVTDPSFLQAVGGEGHVFSAADPGGGVAIAYLSGVTAVSFGPWAAEADYELQWFDPATGQYREGLPGTSLVYAPPSFQNGAGDDDWVLILKAVE